MVFTLLDIFLMICDDYVSIVSNNQNYFFNQLLEFIFVFIPKIIHVHIRNNTNFVPFSISFLE